MECPKCHTEDCSKTSTDGIYRCCNGHTFSVERFSELPGACAGVIGGIIGGIIATTVAAGAAIGSAFIDFSKKEDK